MNINILNYLIELKPGDINYNKIYCILYCDNGFYYSKEVDDRFRPQWDSWTDENVSGGKTEFNYYYYINLIITKEILDDEAAGLEVAVYSQEDFISRSKLRNL